MLTGGTIWGIIALITGAIFLLLALFALFGMIRWGWDEFAPVLGGLSFLCSLPALIIPLIGFGLVGWNSDYLAYHPVSGTVQQMASRQIADGKSMSTRYVAVINGQPYGIDDTRAALLKAGDHVDLNCTKEYQWGSTNNGYACNWG